MEMVAACSVRNLPQTGNARLAALSSPPQQGTSMRSKATR